MPTHNTKCGKRLDDLAAKLSHSTVGNRVFLMKIRKGLAVLVSLVLYRHSFL